MEIRVLSGTVPGTQHVMPGRPNWKNNQDAFCYEWLSASRGFVAVVCDGCGSSSHSEVGANMAAKKFVELVLRELRANSIDSISWERVRDSLATYFDVIAGCLGRDKRSVIEDFFLFTIVGMVIADHQVCIVNIGDGVCAVNGYFCSFGPFPENKPPYLMYSVTGSPVLDGNPALRDFQVNFFSLHGVATVLIGCDGVEDLISVHDDCEYYPGTKKEIGSIDRIFEEDFFNNPDNLRRHLALLNRETVCNGKVSPGLLPDDTTIVLVRIEREDENLNKKECNHD